MVSNEGVPLLAQTSGRSIGLTIVIVIGVIVVVGIGVVVHVPSLLKELKGLQEAGVDTRGRIILSDRAHLVFDFHQTVRYSLSVSVSGSVALSQPVSQLDKRNQTRQGVSQLLCQASPRSSHHTPWSVCLSVCLCLLLAGRWTG